MQGHVLAATPSMVYARLLAQLPFARQAFQRFLTAMTRAAAASYTSVIPA